MTTETTMTITAIEYRVENPLSGYEGIDVDESTRNLEAWFIKNLSESYPDATVQFDLWHRDGSYEPMELSVEARTADGEVHEDYGSERGGNPGGFDHYMRKAWAQDVEETITALFEGMWDDGSWVVELPTD